MYYGELENRELYRQIPLELKQLTTALLKLTRQEAAERSAVLDSLLTLWVDQELWVDSADLPDKISIIVWACIKTIKSSN